MRACARLARAASRSAATPEAGAQRSRLPAIHLSSTVETSTAASAVTAATRAAPRRGAARRALARNILRSPALAPAAARADAARAAACAQVTDMVRARMGLLGGVFGTSRRARVAGTSPAARCGGARGCDARGAQAKRKGLSTQPPKWATRPLPGARARGLDPEPGSNFPFRTSDAVSFGASSVSKIRSTGRTMKSEDETQNRLCTLESDRRLCVTADTAALVGQISPPRRARSHPRR